MRRLAIAICTSVALLASAANGGVLYTGPMSGSPDRSPVCRIVNMGTKAVKGVRITMFRLPSAMPGVLYAESPAFELAPLGTYVLGQIDPPSGPDHFACEFLFGGSGKTLRGSIAIFGGEGELGSEPAR
jgi:hypothetical protein